MKRNILIIFLFGVVFTYGVAVGAKKIFPYQQIKYIKTSFFGNSGRVGSCHRPSISTILEDTNKSQIIKY